MPESLNDPTEIVAPVDATEASEQDWDKERQRADQEHANFEKASAEKEVLAGQLQETSTKIANLENKIKAQAEAANVEIEDLDPDIVDSKVIKSISALQEQLKAVTEKATLLEGRAGQYEQRIMSEEADKMKNATIEKILKPLDKKFGAKFRNDAKKLADDKCAQLGYSPKDALEARDLLEECYEEVKTISEKKVKKEVIPTDTGTGTVSWNDTEVEEGSRAGVLEKMKASGKYK